MHGTSCFLRLCAHRASIYATHDDQDVHDDDVIMMIDLTMFYTYSTNQSRRKDCHGNLRYDWQPTLSTIANQRRLRLTNLRNLRNLRWSLYLNHGIQALR